ncbi:MAG: Gfo/Idh/MocA family protein [Anaerolineae bacterium]
MQRLRIACVGAGSEIGARSGEWFAVINQLHDWYDHVAIMDISEENARTAAAVYRIPRVYTNLDEMLEKEKLDVLVRLTQTDSAVGVCVRAAEAGVHVLSEIPIATTLPQADAIVEACRRNRVKLEIAENVWTWPRERLKQLIVQGGVIGQVTHCRLTYPCGAYHGFSAIRKLVGTEAERVLGWEGRVPVRNLISYGGQAMTETIWDGGLIQFPGGVHCVFEMPPKRLVWRHAWDVEGTKGYLGAFRPVAPGHGARAGGAYCEEALVLDDPSAPELCERPYPIEWVYGERNGQETLEQVRVNTDPPVVWENPYARYGICADDDVSKATYLESLYRMVTEDAPPVYGPENARHDLELWIAIVESARQGNRWVVLPLKEFTSVEQAMHDEFRRRYGCDPITDVEAQLKVRYDRTPVMWTVAGWL